AMSPSNFASPIWRRCLVTPNVCKHSGYTTTMKAAILLIDLLEDFFQEGRLKANRSTLVSHINDLTAVGRVSHLPIIWVRQAFKADLSDAFLGMRKTQTAITLENTPGSQLLSELERDPTDVEVVKKRYS